MFKPPAMPRFRQHRYRLLAALAVLLTIGVVIYTFRIAMHRAAMQEAFFGDPGTSTFVLVVLFGGSGLALVILLLAQQRNIQLLERHERELQSSEGRLREDEEKLRGLYELSPLGIALTDMDGRYIEFNTAFCRICGYPEDELKALDYWTLTPREYAAREAEQLELLSRTGRYGPYEKEYRRKDGSRVPLRLNGMRVEGADGKPYIWSIVEDITERRRTEEALQDSLRFARQLIEAIPSPLFYKDRDGRYLGCNAAFAHYLGKRQEEIVGRSVYDIAPASCADSYSAADRELFDHPGSQAYEARVCQADGSLRDVIFHKATFTRADGSLGGLVGIILDITQRVEAEQHQRLAASVFTNANEGIIITDADNRILDVNAAFTRITGYARDDVLGRNPSLLKSGHQDPEFYVAMWQTLLTAGHWSGELWNRRRDGVVYAELLTLSVVRGNDGAISHFVGVCTDITAQKEHEQALERIAHFDALTGVPNRLLLGDRLSQAIAQTRRAGKLMAVCYLDLDGFKPINDKHGHEAGDRVLVEMANRMKDCVRGGDTVARMGGDEFVLLLLGLDRIEECEAALRRLLDAVALPLVVGNQPVTLSASLGVTLFPQDDADADTLLRHADQAMYLAKQHGKNRFDMFNPEQDRLAHYHGEQLARIEVALKNREFVLHYQPKVNLRLGTVLGVEALIRWQHPEQGLLPPADFLPAIEESDLIVALGDWVIASALQQLAAWSRAGLVIAVSVNIAPRHLLRDDFVEKLRAHLTAYPEAPHKSLELEVLETAAIEDVQRVSRIIRECQQLGVTFALDDFGTGYSSLTYFKTLPAEMLKIDQSFVRDMLTDAEDMAIVEGVIGLAEVFRRDVIAEGVETAEHGMLLLNLGCELAQGFGIARPMPAAELPAWVGKWRPDPRWSGAAGFRWPRDDLPLLIAESDHRRWVEALVKQVEEGGSGNETSDLPETDPLECRFGRWYRGSGRHRYGAHAEFAAVGVAHEEIHVLGSALLQLRDAGRRAAAVARLPELYRRRDQLLDLLHRLVASALLDHPSR